MLYKGILVRYLMNEIKAVSGGDGECNGDGSDSIVGGQSTFSQDAIDLYEGLINTFSYIMERVLGQNKER